MGKEEQIKKKNAVEWYHNNFLRFNVCKIKSYFFIVFIIDNG
jgi:hypothetical protein